MSRSVEQKLKSKERNAFPASFLALIFISLLTFAGSFFISNSTLSFETKTAIWGTLIFLYLAVCTGFYFLQSRQKTREETQSDRGAKPYSDEMREKLIFLEEANELFANSLKSADLFRLISNRLNEMLPFDQSFLFLAEEAGLKAVQVTGAAAQLLESEIDWENGLAGKVLHSRKPVFDENLLTDKNAIALDELKNIKSAIGIPLSRELEVFGVLALCSEKRNAFESVNAELLDEISARVSPLMLNSINYEKSLKNALTDQLTNLPNKRAFFMVLENQIAESQRFRQQRPLSIISLDIKKFNAINEEFGHSAGDQLLNTVAKIIKGQLRQMDFLARSKADEFLAVLPTASEPVTNLIIERIERAFQQNPIPVGGNKEYLVGLNFGKATFIKDGETASALIERAILRKNEGKTETSGSVLFFPSELVN